jgi:hypothetical protein
VTVLPLQLLIAALRACCQKLVLAPSAVEFYL